METNSNSAVLALNLTTQRKSASFTSVCLRKQGKEMGPKGNKTRYGDDMVHVVVVSGFSYESLVKRSLDMLPGLRARASQIVADLAGEDAYQGRGKKAVKVPVTEADVLAALDDLEASFTKSLDPAEPSESTTKHVYEPLVVDGEAVRGSRVYRCVADKVAAGDVKECHCRECSGDSKAPLDGTVYLQGLQIGSKVLEAAPNGPVPASKSGPKVVAKAALRRKLPVSRYVSYRLEAGTDFLLKVGGTAALKADEDGIHISNGLDAILAA